MVPNAVTIDLKNKQVMMEETTIPLLNTLPLQVCICMQETQVIQPQRVTFISGKLPEYWREHQQFRNTTLLIEPYEHMEGHKGVLIARSLCETNKQIVLQVMNTTKQPVTLVKNSTIVHAEILCNTHIVCTLHNPDVVAKHHRKEATTKPSQKVQHRTGIWPDRLDITKACMPPEEKKKLRELILAYSNIFTQDGKIGKTDVQHAILTGEHQPISQPPHRLPPAYHQTVGKELEDMLEKKIIRPSASPWTSPIVLVKKKDGSLRFCVDYRKLNALTKRDSYPLPRIDDTLDTLADARIFSALDLASGYWQIGIKEEDKSKTAFVTKQGLFEFNVMPFGLCNAPATFQRAMDALLAELKWHSTLVYLNDILIYSKSPGEHLHHLQEVFQRLWNANFTLKASKCQFRLKQVKYLGHMISKKGVSPDPEKISSIHGVEAPKNVRKLQQFLGMASYYRRFIKGFADIAAPLTNLLHKETKFEWSKECNDAFQTLKSALTSTPILRMPNFTKAFKLITDASNVGLGAVLTQEENRHEHVIAYASCALNSAECKYSATERECLAIV